jgi:hypothetical protein
VIDDDNFDLSLLGTNFRPRYFFTAPSILPEDHVNPEPDSNWRWQGNTPIEPNSD